MPIYEYQCPKCHTVFEEWLRSVDESDKPCPKCATASPHIVSKTSFALKGDGWYVTEYGYKKEESAPAEKADTAETTPASAGESSAPEAKSEGEAKQTPTSKPEAKPETKADAKPEPAKSETKANAPAEKAAPKAAGTE